MSASRALASAKNKKAGGNNPNPAISVPEQQYSPSVAPPSAPSITKVTIPQAIQMLSGRLDAMEEKLGKAFDALEETRVLEKQSENKYLVDAKVFESVVSRIENLEEQKKSTPQIQKQDNISKSELDTVHANMKNVNKQMSVFKDDFIKLQSYVMDTNAKLTEVVFSIPAESMVDYRDIFVKKTEEPSDPGAILPVYKVNSMPNLAEIVPEPLDIDDSLDRPLLQRQTNHLSTDDLLKINVKPQLDVTNIEDIAREEHIQQNDTDIEEAEELPSL